MRPLVGRDDPRDQVEREDPVGALVVAVDREADPLRQEEGVGDADPLASPSSLSAREPLVERAVVRPRAAGGLEHLVEERPEVVAGDEAGRGALARGRVGVSVHG